MESEILLTKAQIQARVSELASEIQRHYSGKQWLASIVYNGAVFFAADLLRQIEGEFKISGIQVSSYREGTQSGELVILGKLDCANQHVLIIDDIYDTGKTLHALTEEFLKAGAISVERCVLLSKETSKTHPVDVRFSAFSIPDQFVFGYGLDIANRYRNLENIAVAKQSN